MERHDYSADVRPHPSPLMRWALIVVGTLLVGLGILGIILPLLPGTPFLLLAAACYARASTRFYNWLLNNRFVGPTLAEWRRTRRIPRRARRNAIFVVALAFGLTVAFVATGPIARAAYVAMGLLVIAILLRLPVAPDAHERR